MPTRENTELSKHEQLINEEKGETYENCNNGDSRCARGLQRRFSACRTKKDPANIQRLRRAGDATRCSRDRASRLRGRAVPLQAIHGRVSCRQNLGCSANHSPGCPKADGFADSIEVAALRHFGDATRSL